MDQTPRIPLTMTILPTKPGSIQQIPIPMPNFNHVPVQPNIVSNISLEEKERRRLAKQKERNNRYRDKTKPYIELANAPTEKDKIAKLFKLCYPKLEHLPESVFDQEILYIIQYITRERS